MSLHIIYGNAGCGKSTYLYEYANKEARRDPRRSFLFFVPNQFTLTAQRKLVEHSENHGIMNIEVLSFERFSYRVFEELGIDTGEILEDTGKNLLLQYVILQKQEELFVLNNSVNRPGYIDEIKSLFSEFAQYRMDPDKLKEAFQKVSLNPAFQKKGQDILNLYEAYSKALSERYITGEQMLDLLADHVDESRFVKDGVLFLDGYTGFTPVQMHLLYAMAPYLKDIYCAVTMDQGEDPGAVTEGHEHELFAMSHEMISSLTRMAKDLHLEVEFVPVMDGRKSDVCTGPFIKSPVTSAGSRFMAGGYLSALEQRIFREKKIKTKVEHPEADVLHLREYENYRQEIEGVCGEIRKLVEEKHWHYRDIAVITSELEAVETACSEIFSDYGIPFFIDRNRELSYNPLLEMIQSAFSVLQFDFQYDDVVNFMRCPFSGFSPEEVDFFSSYLLRTGIKGKKHFFSHFTVTLNEKNEEKTGGEILVLANEYREKLAGPFQNLYTSLNGEGNVREKTEALYTFLQAYPIGEVICSMEEEPQQINRSIYGKVMFLMDKVVQLLGEEQLSFSDYVKTFLSGMEAFSLGKLPGGGDSVIIGDTVRTRLSDVKAIFFMGANQGVIPQKTEGGGILSEGERLAMAEAGYALAPSSKERSFQQRYYLYLALTGASEYMALSYAKINASGDSVRRSYLFSEILKLFPELNLEHIHEISYQDSAASLTLLAGKVASAYGEGEDRDLMCRAAMDLIQEKAPEDAAKILSGAKFSYHPPIIKKETWDLTHTSLKTGEEVLGLSVSRLEHYGQCPYKYFLGDEVGLREVKEGGFDNATFGTLYHGILKNYSDQLKAKDVSFADDIEQETSDEYLTKAIREEISKLEEYNALDDSYEVYRIERMKSTMKLTVDSLHAQAKAGKYRPEEFEISIGKASDVNKEKWRLSDGTRLRLSGSIDRLDVFEGAEKDYIRIIDYKSGNQVLKPTYVAGGVQYQLITYMDAAVDILNHRGKESYYPGGMFYRTVKTPMVKVDASQKVDEDAVNEQKENELRLDGLLTVADKGNTAGYENLCAMDKQIEKLVDEKKAGASDVLKLKLNKDGVLDSNAQKKVLTEDEMKSLLEKVHKSALSQAENIHKKDFAARPYSENSGDEEAASKKGKAEGCNYCPYSAICGFDPRINGYQTRGLKKYENFSDYIKDETLSEKD